MTRTHVQRWVEISSPELPMMEKLTKHQYVEIQPIPFQNDYPINAQLENTGKTLVALKPTLPLYSIV